MNIFGVGGAELVLIIVIMLVVAGPRRMIRWAYVIGQYVGKFRILWEQMVDVMQDEVDAAGLDVKIPKEIPTRATIAKTASEFIKPYAETMEQTLDEVKKPMQETIDETSKAVNEAKQAGQAAVDDTNQAVKEANKPSFKPATGSVMAAGSVPDDPKPALEPVSSPAPGDTPSEEPKPANFGAWSQPEKHNQPVEGEA